MDEEENHDILHAEITVMVYDSWILLLYIKFKL